MQVASQIREPFFNSFCINTKTRNTEQKKIERNETPEIGEKSYNDKTVKWKEKHRQKSKKNVCIRTTQQQNESYAFFGIH